MSTVPIEVREALEALAEHRPVCDSCELFRSCRSPFMLGRGNANRPALAIIGEVPGIEEDRSGEPFVGATGEFLERMLDSAAIPLGDVYFQNAVRCRPPGKAGDRQIRACNEFLAEELAIIRPKVIIAAGNTALFSLVGIRGILSERGGWREWTPAAGAELIPVMPAANPAFVDKQPVHRNNFLDDLADAYDRAMGVEIPPRKPVVYRVAVDQEEFAELEAELVAATRIAWDIETTTRSAWDEGAAVVCVQFSTAPQTGWLVPVDHVERPDLEAYGLPSRVETVAFLKRVLETPPAPLRGQNIKFDSIFVRRALGIRPAPPAFDCYLAHHLLEEDSSKTGGNGLKAMAWRYSDMGGYERAGMERVGGEDEFYRNLQTAPLEDAENPELALSWYACADVDLVLRIEDALRPRLEEEGLLGVLALELQKTDFLADLETLGATIDWPYREKLMRGFPEQARRLAADLRDFGPVREAEIVWSQKRAPEKLTRKGYVLADGATVGHKDLKAAGGRKAIVETVEVVETRAKTPEPFNLDSAEQVRALCFDVLKLPPNVMFYSEDTDKPSCRKEVMLGWLAELDPDSEAARIIALIRKGKRAAKLFGTYIKPLGALAGVDGRVHTTYNAGNVVTFRISSQRPNLQNLPRDDDAAELEGDELGKGEIKRQYIGRFPGWWVAEIDYSQIELRIAALLSQDEAMLAGLQRGGDLHRMLAGKVFSKRPEDITKPERSKAKGANFGYIYGISAQALSVRLQVPLEAAEKFLKGCDDLYRGFVKWSKATKKAAIADGFTASLFGHRRHLPAVKSADRATREEALRQGVNHPIQCTASNLTLIAGAEAAKLLKVAGLKSRIFGTVHDSFWVTGPPAEREAGPALVKEVLENQPFPWLSGQDPRFPKFSPIIAEVAVGENLKDLVELKG